MVINIFLTLFDLAAIQASFAIKKKLAGTHLPLVLIFFVSTYLLRFHILWNVQRSAPARWIVILFKSQLSSFTAHLFPSSEFGNLERDNHHGIRLETSICNVFSTAIYCPSCVLKASVYIGVWFQPRYAGTGQCFLKSLMKDNFRLF